ncbi:MAG: DUF2490 domain-containing protein [Methylophilus sp.]|uniref:DUF2490 domain-containing protein n=1 Tax=Methylophilus sp. TaxID=29541 RepID=UPI002C69BBDF|nr:DUF2490 domain-containing protein [Methylophilus sp.]HSH86423.1 DUF2490 domain-containing protein [Methylophilus sp.]
MLISPALTMLGSSHAYAGPQVDGGYWFNLRMQGELPVHHFYWDMDINPRWRDEGKHLDTLYLRPAVFYKPDAKTSLWLGHDTIASHPDGKSSYQENRWWQQFQYQFEPYHSITFTNRSRLEERTREGFHDTGHRLRQMFRAAQPVTNHPALSVVVSDEVFINVDQTDWGAHRGLDQNRFFVGVNWKIDKSYVLETGYLNQLVNKATRNLENHVVTTTLSFKF